MKNDESSKSILLMALAVLALGGGLTYWQYSSRSEAQARVDSLMAELPDEAQLQSELQTTTTQLEETRLQLEHVEKGVPTAAYVPTLLRELEQVGLQAELKVTGVRPVPAVPSDGETEEKPYAELEIDITGTGGYRSVMNLLASLQRFPKVLEVRTIGLQPKQGEQRPGRIDLDASVRLKAYIFKEEGATEEGTPEEATAQLGTGTGGQS